MISLVAVLAWQVAAPSSDSTSKAVMLGAFKEYRECTISAALKMERSGEQATMIADTALAACHSMRAAAKGLSAAWLRERYPTVGTNDVGETVEKSMRDTDAGYRAEALAAVLTQRASRK